MQKRASNPQVDERLRAFLSLTDKDESDSYRESLIVEHAGPLIRRILRHRLGFYLNEAGANPAQPDAEDIYANVITGIILRLDELRSAPYGAIINNFDSYVARMAHNACNDLLRKKYPARIRLKNQIERLLERHPEFDMWRNEEAELLCGLAAWQRGNISPPAAAASPHGESAGGPSAALRSRLTDIDVHDEARLPQLIHAVFESAGGPVGVDRLIGLVSELRGVKAQTIESYDDESSTPRQTLADASLSVATLLEMRESLARMWEEISRLPVKQRNAFLLSCQDRNGEDIITLLLVAQVASLHQIALSLEMAVEQLTDLWKRMPLDNATIALEMGATRQQVNKWRWQANEQMRKRFLSEGSRN